jgi:glycosyltransferase involved in cell wall biosynthesis
VRAERVLVVVPTYNERENVRPLVEALLAQGDNVDVWVADDGSPDGTADAVRAVMAEHPDRVDLLLRKEKAGRGAAVIAAFKRGLADPRGYSVFLEMAYQAWVHGFRLGEVPIHFRNRAREASKLSAEEIYMALLNFALLRFRYGWRPRRRATGDGDA